MQSVVIPLSKLKVVCLLFGFALIVLVGYWLFRSEATQSESANNFSSRLLAHGMGLVAMTFGGVSIVAVASKLLGNRPGLVLDENGLTDNTSMLSAGFIPWNEIAGFKVVQLKAKRKQGRMLYVLLKHPKKFITKFGPVKRAILRVCQPMGPSLVAVTSVTLPIDFDELVTTVNSYFEQYQQGLTIHSSGRATRAAEFKR